MNINLMQAIILQDHVPVFFSINKQIKQCMFSAILIHLYLLDYFHFLLLYAFSIHTTPSVLYPTTNHREILYLIHLVTRYFAD